MLKHKLSKQEMRQMNKEIEEMKEENRVNKHSIVTLLNEENAYIPETDHNIIFCLTNGAADHTTEKKLAIHTVEPTLNRITSDESIFFFSGSVSGIAKIAYIIDNFCPDWKLWNNFISIYSIPTQLSIHSSIKNIPRNSNTAILVAQKGNRKFNYASLDSIDANFSQIIGKLAGLVSKEGDNVLDLFPSVLHNTVEVVDIYNCNSTSIVYLPEQAEHIKKQLISIKLR